MDGVPKRSTVGMNFVRGRLRRIQEIDDDTVDFFQTPIGVKFNNGVEEIESSQKNIWIFQMNTYVLHFQQLQVKGKIWVEMKVFYSEENDCVVYVVQRSENLKLESMTEKPKFRIDMQIEEIRESRNLDLATVKLKYSLKSGTEIGQNST